MRYKYCNCKTKPKLGVDVGGENLHCILCFKAIHKNADSVRLEYDPSQSDHLAIVNTNDAQWKKYRD